MYHSLAECVRDLETTGQLIRIKEAVDPHLEMAEIHRRAYTQKGPALLFENVLGSPFPAASNIYGSKERTEFLFRKTIPGLKRVMEIKMDPSRAIKKPWAHIGTGFTALKALPRKSRFKSPVSYGKTTIDQLPQIVSWPDDGGAFITLPQVFTLPPGEKSPMKSNLGMYRIQLSGNEYITNEEVGLHYQIHRGIGVHHTMYNDSDEEFKVSIFVGGPPSHAFSAIMPMPEDLSELTMAGMLGGRRFRYFIDEKGYYISSDADFVITGTIRKNVKKPEGPFGDHFGYYSLAHDFPVMKVEDVYHRHDAIWHFTVVGRPPQEDSSFGHLIHKLVDNIAPHEFPGLVEVNAVDAAGVHPLLLAIGKERYMPFREKKPEEILTIANRILGSGQTSLAKFLIIAQDEEGVGLSTHRIEHFLDHVLRRIDWRRDLHFQTKTTIDTLDYSGSGWNSGSKVVMACCGDPIRDLASVIHDSLNRLDAIKKVRLLQPGILLLEIGSFVSYEISLDEMENVTTQLASVDLSQFPLIVLVDNSDFTSKSLNNFLWVTFTRSNPSHDIHGINSFIEHKHWGCRGSLIIDARKKPHHAPELIVDERTKQKVDKRLGKGGDLYGLLY